MFVFYFGILADATPPVVLAAYAGATLACSQFWKTAINAIKYALAGYIIPYIFVQHSEMLIVTVPTWTSERVYSLITGIIASILIILPPSSGIVEWLNGKLNTWTRTPLIALGIVSITTTEPILIASTATYISICITPTHRPIPTRTKTNRQEGNLKHKPILENPVNKPGERNHPPL